MLRKNIRIPSILLEAARVAVTPMGSSLRFGGTMEIGGINRADINNNRVRGIVDSIPKVLSGNEGRVSFEGVACGSVHVRQTDFLYWSHDRAGEHDRCLPVTR